MTRKRLAPASGTARGPAAAHVLRPVQEADTHATVDRILDGARRVLVEFGYSGFTTRRVAEAASIAPGNLSYHFPSKRELVRALIARLMADLSYQYTAFLSDTGIPLGQEVATLVRWALNDTVSEEPVHIFRELWTMALRDAEIRKAVDDLYDELMNSIVRQLLRTRPWADEVQIREFVHVLALMSEGGNVLYGTRRARAVPYERIIEIALGLQGMLAPDLQQGATHSREGSLRKRKQSEAR
jgi:AcrR family transcriptional regulator